MWWGGLLVLLWVSTGGAVEFLCNYEVTLAADGEMVRVATINSLTDALRADLGLTAQESPWTEEEIGGADRNGPNRVIVTLPDRLSAAMRTQISARIVDGGAACPDATGMTRIPARAPRRSNGALTYDREDPTRPIIRRGRQRQQTRWEAPSRFVRRWLGPTLAWALGAAPVTAILDNFNRVEDPLTQGGAWSALSLAGSATGAETNGSVLLFDGTFKGTFRVATYPHRQEVYATLSVASGVEGGGLYSNLQTPGTANYDGYRVYLTVSGTVLVIHRVDNTVSTQLGADVSQAFDAADRILLRNTGGTLHMGFSNDGAAWSILTTRSDSTYGAGSLGVVTGSSVAQRWDDYGGGALPNTGGWPVWFR